MSKSLCTEFYVNLAVIGLQNDTTENRTCQKSRSKEVHVKSAVIIRSTSYSNQPAGNLVKHSDQTTNKYSTFVFTVSCSYSKSSLLLKLCMTVARMEIKRLKCVQNN